MRFERRVALVTGGGTGIGAATVRALSREGAALAIASEVPIEQNTAFCEQLRSAGTTVESFQCDVADARATAHLVDEVRQLFGRIDVVVHCAGMFQLNPVFDCDPRSLDRLVDINFKGTYNIIHAAAPLMRAHGGGAIVCVASASGVLGQPPYSAYSASKAAVIHLVRSCAAEFKGSGIRLNCIAPGATRTPMTAHAHSPLTAEQEAAKRRLEQSVPSPYNKPWLEPEDQADVILFLASDAARAIHGACVVTDQGLSASMPWF